MKYHKILFAFFLVGWNVQILFSQSTWQWSRQSKNDELVSSGEVATDKFGNVYCTGTDYGGYMVFGADTIHCQGNGAAYLVKYDPNGNVTWAKSYSGGNDVTRFYSICTDSSGNIFGAGYFSSPTEVFGNDTLTNHGTNGSWDILVMKFDSSGNILWARNAGGSSDDHSWGITADGAGSVYITGGIGGPVQYGPFLLTTPSGFGNVFIAKYNGTGDLIWAKCAGGLNIAIGNAVAVDHSGHLYLTGQYNGQISFSSISLPSTSGSGKAVYLIQFDTSGTSLWGKSFGGINNSQDNGNSISVDLADNVYVTGFFTEQSITIGTQTMIDPIQNDPDLFIIKYNSQGNNIWAKCASAGSSQGYSISCNSSAFLYVVGYFNIGARSYMAWGNDTIFEGQNSSAPLFVFKVDSAGNAICSTTVTCGSWSHVAADPLGDNAYIVDTPSATVIIGTDTLHHSSSSLYYVYVAKWNCNGIMSNVIAGEKDKTFALNCFPNPTNSQVNISFHLPKDENASISLFDVYGKQLSFISDKEFSAGDNVISLDMQTLLPGIYLFRFSTSSISNQILIERE